MIKTNYGLVAYAKAQLGLPYWYGTFGQIGKEAVRNFASYCVKPFTFAASGVITNHIMSLDGGIQSPSRGSIFTINDETYIGIIGNYALKV